MKVHKEGDRRTLSFPTRLVLMEECKCLGLNQGPRGAFSLNGSPWAPLSFFKAFGDEPMPS